MGPHFPPLALAVHAVPPGQVKSSATLPPQAAMHSGALFPALQVPYTLLDEEIPDIWECRDNQWDAAYASCETAQALTDAAIDSILAGQQDIEAELLPLAVPVLDDNDEPYDDDG